MEESEFEQMAVRLRRVAENAGRACGLGPAAAEDIAQDVMLKLWSLRGRLDKGSSVEGLAAVMARRLSLNMLRDARTVSIGELTCRVLATAANPQEALEEKENAEWLDRMMEALPATQHTILYMRQVERRTNREIASLLGIGEASVSTLLARARRALLEELRMRQ